MQSTLDEYRETHSHEAFALQNPKLLRVSLEQVTVQARLGSMVAYQGDVAFEHAGAGGVGRFLKKRLTGEGAQLMRISGSGQVFLAERAQDVHPIKLEDDEITCNGRNVLAFDAGIDWDVKKVEGGVAGAMAGGFFNMALAGSGWVALVSNGPPVLLHVGEAPTFCDPEAAISWSRGVRTRVKSDVNLRTLIGRASGETIQLGFSGAGWVLVQPSEGVVEGTGQLSGGQSGGGGLLDNPGG